MERVPNDRSMDSIGLVLRPRDALWCSFSGRDAAGSGGARARARASRRARSGGKIGTGHTRRTRSSWASRHARATSAARLRPRGSVRRNTPVSPKPTSSSPVVATPRARGNAWVLSPAYLRQAPRSCFGGLRVTRRDEGSVRGCRVRSEWRAAARSIENVRDGFHKKGVLLSHKKHIRASITNFAFLSTGFPVRSVETHTIRSVSSSRSEKFSSCSTSTFLANTLVRMRFQSRRDPKGASRVLQVRRILGQDEVVTPWGSSRVLTPDRAARTPRDTLARVRSLARHATRAFVKRRTRLPRLVLRGP